MTRAAESFVTPMAAGDDAWGTPEDVADPQILPSPVGMRVLIRPVGPKEKSKGGILLPDQAKDAEEYNNARGRVLAVGPMAFRDKRTGTEWFGGPWAKKGDWVIFGKFAGQKIVVSGVKMILINDEDITATIPNPDIMAAYI